MSRKTYKPSAFKRWLQRRKADEFDYDDVACPIAQWTGMTMDKAALNHSPPWVNRFVGSWDEASTWCHPQLLNGNDAIRILKESI